MLPFLKPKAQGTVIIEHRSEDGRPTDMHDEGDDDHALQAVAEDMLRAFHSKDAKLLAEALKSAHEICESYDESPEEDNESEGQ